MSTSKFSSAASSTRAAADSEAAASQPKPHCLAVWVPRRRSVSRQREGHHGAGGMTGSGRWEFPTSHASGRNCTSRASGVECRHCKSGHGSQFCVAWTSCMACGSSLKPGQPGTPTRGPELPVTPSQSGSAAPSSVKADSDCESKGPPVTVLVPASKKANSESLKSTVKAAGMPGGRARRGTSDSCESHQSERPGRAVPGTKWRCCVSSRECYLRALSMSTAVVRASEMRRGCIPVELGIADWVAAPIGMPVVSGGKAPRVMQSRKSLLERHCRVAPPASGTSDEAWPALPAPMPRVPCVAREAAAARATAGSSRRTSVCSDASSATLKSDSERTGTHASSTFKSSCAPEPVVPKPHALAAWSPDAGEWHLPTAHRSSVTDKKFRCGLCRGPHTTRFCGGSRACAACGDRLRHENESREDEGSGADSTRFGGRRQPGRAVPGSVWRCCAGRYKCYLKAVHQARLVASAGARAGAGAATKAM